MQGDIGRQWLRNHTAQRRSPCPTDTAIFHRGKSLLLFHLWGAEVLAQQLSITILLSPFLLSLAYLATASGWMDLFFYLEIQFWLGRADTCKENISPFSSSCLDTTS